MLCLIFLIGYSNDKLVEMETLLLERLFRQYYGETPDRINPLKGDGSERRVYRMQNANRTVIGVVGDHRPENEAFVHFTQHFFKQGLPVPEIYTQDLEHGIYLEKDLGYDTLFEWATLIRQREGFNVEIIEMYKKVLSWLPHFQISAGQSLDYSFCYQHDVFGKESISWDLQYFHHRFLTLFYKHPIDKNAIDRDFANLVDHLIEEDAGYFLYRDFQSRNVMILNKEPYFIDYQSGRRGALQYDVASLLFDAKANIPQAVREELLHYYLDTVQQIHAIDRTKFMHYFYSFVMIRVMQAFGAYGYLAGICGKKNFLKSVPYALQNLHVILLKAEILDRLPTLRVIFDNLIKDESLYQF